MKLATLLCASAFVLLPPSSQAGWDDLWNWWAGQQSEESGQSEESTQSGGSSGLPPKVQEPTAEEVDEINTEIVGSASAVGTNVNPQAIEGYARSLARTLKTLTPGQRARVLTGTR